MNNPLWQFSLEVYRREGVEALLLQLQDDCGLDVNMLLYAAWLGARDIQLDAGHCADVQAATAEWREGVVVPLRELRRQLRCIEAADGVRERVKALELEAEAEQQRLIYACHRAADLIAGGATVSGNLRQVAAAGGADDARCGPPVTALAALLCA